jgi:hypothetical protein
MDECPLRLCAYVYPDAESNGDYGHLFNECLARTTKLAVVIAKGSKGYCIWVTRVRPDAYYRRYAFS